MSDDRLACPKCGSGENHAYKFVGMKAIGFNCALQGCKLHWDEENVASLRAEVRRLREALEEIANEERILHWRTADEVVNEYRRIARAALKGATP